jgi:hypothetical protein
MPIRPMIAVFALVLLSGCGCGMAGPAALDTALQAMPSPAASTPAGLPQ